MSKVRIETTQNVTFNYEAASITDRIFATLIDLLIRGVYWWIIYSIINDLTFSEDGAFDNGVSLTVLTILMLPNGFYTPLSEYFFRGQTLGKMALRIRVIHRDGSLPSFIAVMLRWFTVVIDFFLLHTLFALLFQNSLESSVFWSTFSFLFFLSPFVAITFINKNGQGQRIGDYLANTVVIKHAKQLSLADTVYRSLKKDYEPKYTNVLRLNDRDIRILQEALDHYYLTKDNKHIVKLASKAKEILEIQQKVRAVQFLERLIRDYNYLAVKRDES